MNSKKGSSADAGQNIDWLGRRVRELERSDGARLDPPSAPLDVLVRVR
jgi:hypothetical protein